MAHFPILADKYAALAAPSVGKSTHSSLKGTKIVTSKSMKLIVNDRRIQCFRKCSWI